jgi:ubiquinone/menaquinone biosynthesis C-methylase UbiE
VKLKCVFAAPPVTFGGMDADILEYYDRGGEDTRLIDSIELLRTKVLLRRYLPNHADILDVGGGSGVYATWLEAEGHTVRLIDPVPRHVQTALARGIDAVGGDARALDEPDGSRDAVLLFGPLYHLLDRAERVRALAEAGRVTRDLVIAAVISRWSPMFEGMLRGLVDSPGFLPMLREDLATGTRRATQHIPFGFTTCYFHRPEEIISEIADAGLTLVDLLPIEGMAHWIPDLANRLADPDKRAIVLELLEHTEREPAILGATAHLLAVARKTA